MNKKWQQKNRSWCLKILAHDSLQKLKNQFDEADLFAAGRRMLQANLDENWLGRGLYSEAAIWLKIVYGSHDLLLTPVQIICKAYDDMPNVTRSDFLKNV